MPADIPTLFLMIIVVSGTLGVSVLAMARKGQRDGLLLWAGGMGLHTLTYLLYSLRGSISDVLSIVGGNVALSATIAVLTEGLFQFQGRRPPRALIWAPVPVVCVLFALLLEHQSARVVAASIFISVQCAVPLVALLQHRQATVGRGKYFLSTSFALIIGVFALRGIVVATGGGQVASITQASPLQTVSFLVVAIAMTVMNLGFVIMTKERADERNRFLAERDMLTGLRNRRALIEALEQQLAQAQRGGTALTVMLIDIDHFKQVNDTHGHLSGDRVLKAFGAVLGARTRAQDIAGRFGGEEFLLILPNTTMAGGLQVAETLRTGVATTRFEAMDGTSIPITVSAGMHVFDPDGDRNCDDLISAADRALYRAKSGGRNRIEAFNGLQLDPSVA